MTDKQHCFDPQCSSCVEAMSKINDIHAMLTEIMPTFRRAAKLMDNSVAVRIREAMKKR